MYILRIEHPVPNFEGWKQAFDNDPMGRERSGVRRYRVLRPVEDANYAIVHLEFDSLEEAERMLLSLRRLWQDAEGRLMTDPRARILEAVESREY